MKALGEAASELPWLAPAAGSLAALAKLQFTSIDTDTCRSPTSIESGSEDAHRFDPAWSSIRRDPGAVLLLLRAANLPTDIPDSELIFQPAVLETALEFMRKGKVRFVAWNKPGADKIYRKCLEYAGLAEVIASKVERCNPQHAWIGGLLAPLGWLALCAVDPDQVARAVVHASGSNPQCLATWQHQTWGLDHPTIARRLSRSWGLPAWLASTVSHLGLPVEIACGLGADPVLFQVVQLAVAWSQKNDPGLALPVGAGIAELLGSLDLSMAEMRRLRFDKVSGTLNWQPPGKRLLLKELLNVALAASRQREQVHAETSRCRIDLLHKFLAEQRGNEHLHLQAQKMSALAELAAGAGHEINNPLAVISGQAQYITRQLDQAASLVPEEPALAEYLQTLQAGIIRSLKTIVGQSQRIHQVLIDLMQFARPSPPRPQIVGIRELLRDLAQAMQDLAHVKKVRLAVQDVPDTWRIRVDSGQLTAALLCLLRNAVEAAPRKDGRDLRAEISGSETLKLLVEDSGPGPTPEIQEHMFDPFYSGRSAGRGRGLGLPIAWRLAQQQGGEVYFDGHVQGITRFVLSLPGLQVGYAVPHVNKESSPANRAQEPELSNCVA